MKKELEKAGVKDAQVLDKSYWIQRVGEVSLQYCAPVSPLHLTPNCCFLPRESGARKSKIAI